MSEHRASAERFLGARVLDPTAVDANTIGIIGVPYDGAVTYRGGAGQGPAGIRAASDSIETYCPLLDADLADLPLMDLGNVDVKNNDGTGRSFVDSVAAQLDVFAPCRLLGLGGDHLIAYPFLARVLKRFPDVQILHIDAHTDLREEWEGEPFNHATVLRRVLDCMPPTSHLYQWGIRSGLRTEFQLAHNDGRITHVANTKAAALEVVQELVNSGKPVYITLDVDGIDASEIPGTGTPEPGGLRFRDVEDVLVYLGKHLHAPVVGADLVELAPGLDPSGISVVATARLARTLLLLLGLHPV